MAHPYSARILEHFRHPRNFGDLAEPDVVREVFNPVCGDRVRVSLKLTGGVVQAMSFKGDACAITMAAASLLSEHVRGMRAVDVEALGRDDVLSLLEAEIPPARMRCALLPLEAVHAGIASDPKRGT
jgi:nitrogen fixation NifU-like protein